jgi:hypothetical protein
MKSNCTISKLTAYDGTVNIFRWVPNEKKTKTRRTLAHERKTQDMMDKNSVHMYRQASPVVPHDYVVLINGEPAVHWNSKRIRKFKTVQGAWLHFETHSTASSFQRELDSELRWT